MKAALIVVVLSSVLFALFSGAFGSEAGRVRRGNDYDRIARARGEIHDVVRPVSLLYFGVSLVVFAVASRHPSRRMRTAGPIAVVICAAMAFWSLLLSGAVSFDEVFPAWVLAALGLAGLAVPGLRKEKAVSA